MQWSRSILCDGIEPTSTVPWVVDGQGHFGESNEPRDLMAEILEGKTLLLSFSSPNVLGEISCANERIYQFIDADTWAEGDYRVYPNGVAVLDDDLPFTIGEIDYLGYLVNLQDGYVTIKSAILGAGIMCFMRPDAKEQRDCGPLDEPMYDYVRQFIRT